MTKLKSYQWILFDADDTLFHFDAFSGLQRMFAGFGVDFTKPDYHAYQEINKPLWVDYQNGNLTAQQVQRQRFDHWADKLHVSSQDLNSAFLAAMAEICTPLDGAVALLGALKDKAKLGIITNGFTELQRARLARTGLGNHFDVLVISEEVGVAKPHRGIFEHALSMMGQPARSDVLMVGDNPDSDILGGLNAGLDTCWLNVDNRLPPEGIMPHYQVASLRELECLLFGGNPGQIIG